MPWHNELNQELTAFEKHVFDRLMLFPDLQRRLHEMAIDLTDLKAAQVRVQGDITKLIQLAQTAISNQQDPTLQGQLDDITTSLGGAAKTAEDELALAAAGSTGASGTSGSTGTDGSTGASGPTGA